MSEKRKYLVLIVSVLLLILPIRYTIERVKPFSKIERKKDWISNMIKLEDENKQEFKVIFNCKFPIETMFHTNLIAYEVLPDIEKLEELIANNYTVFIDNKNEIPVEKANLANVKYVKITGQIAD